MADPVLADFFRAQVIFQGKSNLAEDVFVNSFVFRNDNISSDLDEVADDCAARLHNFYTGLADGQTATLASFLSGTLINADYTIKVYDLGQPTPRLPATRTRTLTATSGAAALPPEVAVCLSYYAGRPLPRRRGRIFLGPLTTSSMDIVGNTVRVAGALRDAVATAAAGLATSSVAAEVEWCMLSGVDANAFEITGGWVDDAHDTQRRRGVAASNRTLWGAPPTSG